MLVICKSLAIGIFAESSSRLRVNGSTLSAANAVHLSPRTGREARGAVPRRVDKTPLRAGFFSNEAAEEIPAHLWKSRHETVPA